VRDTLSLYGDHFCEIFKKSDFKYRSYGLDTILLQGHTVTLTFKVASQIARDTSSQYGDHFCEIFLKSDFK
jgi:methenyltetrahydromethanopterin cyclohydrolase